MKRVVSAFAACLFLFVSSKVSAETIMDRIKNGEPIRHAIANGVPMGYVDKSGNTVGIEVELVRMILQKMGVKNLEETVTTFGALIPGIQAGRFDIASDAIYIRPERCQVVLFSQPDFMFGIGAFSRSNADITATSVDDLATNKSLRFGKLTGGGEDQAIVAAGGSEDQISDFTDRASLVSAVKAGRIDVGLLTRIGAAGAVATNPGLKLIGPLKPPVVKGKPYIFYTAFAFNKADQPFVDEFNKNLTQIVHSPEYPKLLAKYKVPADVVPDNTKTAEICGGQ